MFGSGAMEQATVAVRNRRYFDQRQQAAGMFIGLFVGGVIAPLLIVFDTQKGLYRGLFLISISVVIFLFGLAAWLKLPKDQRTWKSMRSPR